MDGRWVCRRCFSSNLADAMACASCGLERGAEVPESDRMLPAQEPARAGRPWLPILGRFWWVGLIVVIAIGGWWFSARRDDAGQITGAGDLQVTDLRVGDCFDLKDATATEVEQVEAKPCTQAHEFEIFHAGDVDADAYPGDAVFDGWVLNECIPEFGAYVGLAYEASVIDFSYFTPSEGGWNDGDHAVQCVLYDPGNPDLTASLRNAQR